ncbi:MAG: peptidoglycan-binding protein [Methylococcaceae bacterium]
MKTKITTLLVALTLAGCATTPETELSKIQDELDRAQEKNDQLQATVDKSSADLQSLSVLNRELKSSAASASSNSTSSEGSLLPPNAKPGECYARVLTPATYRTESKEVLKKQASYRINVTKPTYEWVTERVLVKEASEVAKLIPARYEMRTESVLVKEAYDELKTIPATYESKTEKILVKAAYTTWKKGRGPIEKVSNSTGEIMCLVEIPAEYRTISSTIMVTSARTDKTTTPAAYKDVTKRVMVEGPTMVKRTIPAEYKSIKVRKVSRPAQENRVEIPAVYQTVTNRVVTSDSYLEWRSILCETNTTGDIVRTIQRALLSAGHNPGSIDGVLGTDTMLAVKSYQKKKNLAVGQLTFETLKSLGVSH